MGSGLQRRLTKNKILSNQWKSWCLNFHCSGCAKKYHFRVPQLSLRIILLVSLNCYTKSFSWPSTVTHIIQWTSWNLNFHCARLYQQNLYHVLTESLSVFFLSYLTILAELLYIVVAIANICVQHAQKSIIFVTHNCRPIYLFCVPQLSPPLLSENLGAGSFIALIFYLLNHHFSVPHLSLTVSNENHGTFIFTVQVLQKSSIFVSHTSRWTRYD